MLDPPVDRGYLPLSPRGTRPSRSISLNKPTSLPGQLGPPTLPTPTLLWPHWLLCCPLNPASVTPPQGLCTYIPRFLYSLSADTHLQSSRPLCSSLRSNGAARGSVTPCPLCPFRLHCGAHRRLFVFSVLLLPVPGGSRDLIYRVYHHAAKKHNVSPNVRQLPIYTNERVLLPVFLIHLSIKVWGYKLSSPVFIYTFILVTVSYTCPLCLFQVTLYT